MEEETQVKLPERYKNGRYIIGLVIIFLIIAASHAFVGRKMYVAGGRVACDNTDMILNEDFECEQAVVKEKTELEEALDNLK